MRSKMLIVRFVSDWSLYAAGDQAAFNEAVAMALQQKGIAMVVGPAAEAVPPVHVPATVAVPMQAPIADDKRRTRLTV